MRKYKVTYKVKNSDEYACAWVFAISKDHAQNIVMNDCSDVDSIDSVTLTR